MKKLFTVLTALIAAMALTSCDIRFLDSTYIVPKDAFQNAEHIDLRQGDDEDILNFIVIADPHYGRELRDGGNITRNEKPVMELLRLVSRNGQTYPVVLLGDVQDTGQEIDEKESIRFIEDMRKADAEYNTSGIELPVFFTCGNHELEADGVEHWEETYRDHAHLTGAYTVGNTAVYNVNSAYRIFGGEQLRLLEKALKKEDREYDAHLFFNHIPLASSKVDQTLFEFIIGDERERNEMQRIMREHTPAFMLSGHHHKGNIMSRYNKGASEFIFSAFHRRDVFFESPGRWYIFSLYQESGECIIYGFDLDTVLETLDRAEWEEKARERYSFQIK